MLSQATLEELQHHAVNRSPKLVEFFRNIMHDLITDLVQWSAWI